jgi:hypothetical protein
MADQRIDIAIAKGRERLLDAEPELARRADQAATERARQDRKTDRMEYYEAEIDREIDEYAKSQGVETLDMLIELGTGSLDEAKKLIAERRKHHDTVKRW